MGNINTSKKDDSLLFYQFMCENGFNQDNYDNILELVQSVPYSISTNLKGANHFLLSKKVDYLDLEKYNIRGANGYIDTQSGIVIPTSLISAIYFEYYQSMHMKNKNPDLFDFDSIIAYHNFTSDDLKQLKALLQYHPKKDYYFGFITSEGDKNLDKKLQVYNYFLGKINANNSNKHEIVKETISKTNKELYLIKKQASRRYINIDI